MKDTDLEAEFRKEELIPVEHDAPKPFFLKRTFTALKYRNYKLWFWGQMTSLLGTWMQTTAQGFLIYDLTHSPVYLGFIGFAYGLPTWGLMLFGGVVADRFSKRSVLLITQSVMMLLAVILATLTFTHVVQPWHIITLSFMLGIANSFDGPSRQAFVNELVAREDLTNAIALNATLFNTASATGPAIAGITYALAGPAWCFTINALSFLGVIAALKKMKIQKKEYVPNGKSALEELKEGLKYVYNTPSVRTIILFVGTMSIFGISFTTLFPAWAVKILGGDAATNGFLQSARGAGALIGALTIATLGRIQYKGKLLTTGQLVFPVMIFAFSFIRVLPFSLATLFLIGGFQMFAMNLSNALVQSTVPDNLRGRVMGIYMLTFFGCMPLGALSMGTLAQSFSEPVALEVGAGVTFTVALLIMLFAPAVRKLK